MMSAVTRAALLPLLLGLAAGCGGPQPSAGIVGPPPPARLSPPEGAARADHVVLISIDGLRPDAIEEAPAPHLLGLIRRGAWCPTARTVLPSVTLPSHAAMLTGLDYARHRVTWNNYRPGHIPHPTVLSVASQSGLTTAMLFSKDKFHFLANPYAVSWIYGSPPPLRMPLREDYDDPAWVEKRLRQEEEAEKRPPSSRPSIPRPSDHRTSAEGLARAFAEVWPREPFALTFIHLREPDEAGHRRGWMGLDYLHAVREADRAVGRIIEAVEASGRLDRTAIVVSSDHGGSGRGHYRFTEPNRAENVTIPWICAGPGVRPGTVIDRVVRTYDTAPTVLALLGLGAPEGIDGRPVAEVLR